MVDELDACAQECNVVDAFVLHHSCTGPHSCPLDVNANIVLVGKLLTQSYGILTLSTS